MITHVVNLLVTLGATLIGYGLYNVSRVIYQELTSSTRDLPGPKTPSLLYGHLKEIQDPTKQQSIHEAWVREYGRVFQYKGLFNISRLYIADTKALDHILINSYDYQKPQDARYILAGLVGPGVLVVEKDEHKRQNPAFSAGRIREYTQIFLEKAAQLRDIWRAKSARQGHSTRRIDVLSWLSKMTLDVIGLAGFNYSINALTDQKSELNDAFDAMFNTESQSTFITRLKATFPIFRLLRTERDTRIQLAQDTMARIGNQLLRESKAQAAATGEKQSNRDLLSLLVRANMSSDIPESQRMSDRDVLAQVPTFIVAGHETTSNGTAWALFALTQDLRVQTKLREELFTIDTDNPTMDQLNALPYLDMVVRESLRMHPPAPYVHRQSMKDDILPLRNPVIDCKGEVHHTIRKTRMFCFNRVRKGQIMMVPIIAVNRDKSIWGEDADEFRPERWESISEASSEVPGVWGNMLTFLGGPRACIGYRFALIELKALLFTLVRAFEFELGVPPTDIAKKLSGVVQKPVLVTEPNGVNQMPLLIKRYNRA
ncbi:cytochrome P450 [Tricholoma matsutake]|nr:cytochrome P450 [Tricholoma matsutake 945]